MNNEDVIQQIIDIVCNRFEDMIKSMVSANLENGIGSQDYSPLVEAITVDELASLLKVSKPVAYELANSEGFPSFRIGKNIRVDKRGLSDWMSKQTAVRKGTQQTWRSIQMVDPIRNPGRTREPRTIRAPSVSVPTGSGRPGL